jgi:hypothetical protein
MGLLAAISGVAIRLRQTESRRIRGRPAPRRHGISSEGPARCPFWSILFDAPNSGDHPPWGFLVLASRRSQAL